MDVITTLAALGIMSVDDDLVDAALSEIQNTSPKERSVLDPGKKIEYLLVHHNLAKVRR